MDTSVLKYFTFIKTVKYGSFTKAAEVLHYSQSGISRMIHDLESEWGVVLLERSRAGVRLSGDGAHMLSFAKDLCRDYEKMQAQIDELRGVQTGLIRIGTFSSIATHVLPQAIKAFHAEHSGVDFEMLSGDYLEIERQVEDGRADFGFVRLPAGGKLETEPFLHDEFLAVLPENHPIAQNTSEAERISLKALCEDPFILLERGDNTEITDIFHQNGLHPNIKYTTWEDYAIMAMVESGLGISVLPHLILRRIPYKIAVRPIKEAAFREIGIAFRSKEMLSAAGKAFLGCLLKTTAAGVQALCEHQ